ETTLFQFIHTFFSRRLQLFYKTFDSFERSLNLGKRVRKRKSHIAFSVVTEGCAGQSGHAGLVQKAIGKFVAWYTSAADIWKKIKRAKRLQAANTRNSV